MVDWTMWYLLVLMVFKSRVTILKWTYAVRVSRSDVE